MRKGTKLSTYLCIITSYGVLDSQAAECLSCEPPSIEEIPFCAEFVHYSACRTSGTWQDMDEYAQNIFINKTKLYGNDRVNPQCATTLKRVECSKIFNVCELGTVQNFCFKSCDEAITSNCTVDIMAMNRFTSIQDDFCGHLHNPAKGVTENEKCFDLEYVGPKHSAWIAGFMIAVIFSFLASVGINLQKKALKQNELSAQESNTDSVPVYRLPLWCLGFFLILAGSILDFVAFGLAPQSLLAPLAALTLVWNMMLAPCFNKEKLSSKDIAATLVIFTGATIAVVFASHASPTYNLDILLELYKDPLTCIYFVVVIIVVFVHFALIRFVEHFNLTSRRHRMIQLGQPALWSRVRLIAYSGLSGTMGGQSVLFAKSTAEMLKSAIEGDNCFVHFEAYLIILGLVVCLLCQIHFLNCGLVHFDALSVVPIYQAYWIISGVMGGAIYFQEIRSFSVEQACFFVLGIMTTITGVVLLSQRKPAVPHYQIKRKSTIDKTTRAPDDLKLHGSKPIPETDPPPTIQKYDGVSSARDNESEINTTEESEGESEEIEHNDQVNRHVIDNYLDMSPSICITEILGGLGYQASQRTMFSRLPSSRMANDVSRSRITTVDDFEVGLATRDERPERTNKRRSITFTSFSSANK